jgi:trehalose/maltose hydrolase-like predicted phosphorylase
MSTPLSPDPVTHGGSDDLPAYISNGLIGLRLLDIPLLPGIVLVNGFTGLHQTEQIESAAPAPYPIAGDIGLNGVWLTTAPQQAEFVAQTYDFASGEVHTVFTYNADAVTARVEVVTFCSRKQPTLVLQQVTVSVDAVCDLVVRALLDGAHVPGRMARRTVADDEERRDGIEGSIAWESLGGQSKCGMAYSSTFLGDDEVQPGLIDWGTDAPLATEYRVRARPGRRYRLQQIASVVPSRLHNDADHAARRLVGRAAATGFDGLRRENRIEWHELWKGRILIDSDDDLWQRLADAAFFYLNTSVHPSAPSSTSIYGLAQWNDYHYYYGHVMWDIEFFCIPPLLLMQPDAARSMLEYRIDVLDAAHQNARLNGRRGYQFPWESGPLHGEEAAPRSGRAAWYEDHVSADVAWAFAQYAHATGDRRFLGDYAAPVLYGVADWITSRVTRTRGGFDFNQSMGIAEREQASDNESFTIMGAQLVLREATRCARDLGHQVVPAWVEVEAGLNLPMNRQRAIVSHDKFRRNEQKGATPGPLAGLFPMWYPVEPEVERRTIDYYLQLAQEYVGSPMLSPLFGVWASWAGNRRIARQLLEQGYADLIGGRYLQTLEMAPKKFPDEPRSGPFFANLGGFLAGLLYGLPGIRIGPEDPDQWPVRPVTLPAGWRSIEVERAWIRGQPARIIAGHGMDRARIEVRDVGRRRREAA